MSLEFAGNAKKMTLDDFEAAAQKLNCDLPTIRAVTEVEARGSGFLADGRPVILFERHKFSKFTGRQFDGSHPGISNRQPGGYGRGGTHQYERLHNAIALDREAALRSASWGAFQIMGFNHTTAGYPDVESFVDAMTESEGRHLQAFVDFVLANPVMARALRGHDWATFARHYNGPNFRENEYDRKLATAFAKFARDPQADIVAKGNRILDKGDRGDDVRRLQLQLNDSNVEPHIVVDGIFGDATDAAVRDFQTKMGLTVDGKVGPITWMALTGDDDEDEEQDDNQSMAPAANLAGFYNHYSQVDQEAWEERWPNFSPKEIACKGTGKLLVNEHALDCLQELRDRLGKPMTINSAYRSPEHNATVGGARRSKHLAGIAFDVSTSNLDRDELVTEAKAIGFRGIGYYRTFIHIDTRPSPATWGTP